MKRIIIYCVLLLLFGFTSSNAQAIKSRTDEKAQQTKSMEDPKLSPEEQALRLSAGEDNPAKIDESIPFDPKIDPKDLPAENDYGASNAKPAEGADIDPKLDPERSQKEKQAAPVPVTTTITGADQPAGEKSGTVQDYRNISGGNDQPRGDEPKSILNYRDIQGSTDQPPGDQPNK